MTYESWEILKPFTLFITATVTILNLGHRNKFEIEFKKKNNGRGSRSSDNTELVISRCSRGIGPLQDPVTWYGINYTGKQITQWDFQNKGTLTSPARLSFVLKVPLRYLRPSVIYSVPCDRILQRAYFSKPRRRRKRERHQTKGLMSRTIAVHVLCTFLCSPLQNSNVTECYVFWRTRTAMANFCYLL